MLIGEYLHTIDNKKRLAIPAKLREKIGKKAVITRGLDNCLFLYPLREWETLADKLSKLPIGQGGTRSFIRLMLAGASEVETDSLGRVLIPDYLKTYAELKKEVIIAGLYNRLEIWDKEKWSAYKETAGRSSEEIAEKLGELGVY